MKSTSILKNTFWGTISSVAQNILYSIFFIIVARKYDTHEFSNYILANTLYGMILSFSSMGLGQWFIRNLEITNNRKMLIHEFISIQIQSGIIFYFILVIAALMLYGLAIPSQLAFLIGLNIIFDNIIYAIKCINIANYEQRRTFRIMLTEAGIKVMLGLTLFIFHTPISYMVLMIVILRFLTLQWFLKETVGVSMKLQNLIANVHRMQKWKIAVTGNWAFVMIGSISVLFWSAGNILASKFLSLTEVGYYEISFKLFAMAEIIPLMVTTTLFPHLVANTIGSTKENPEIYRKSMLLLNAYGVLSYLFVHAYASIIIPLLFGVKYTHAATYTSGMFLTMLIFPMSLLQANLLVANKKEKTDMWLNVTSLIAYLLFAIIGLYYTRDLAIINHSIFLAFLLFNLLQTALMYKLGWQKMKQTISTYASIALPVATFIILENLIDKTILFPLTLAIYLAGIFITLKPGNIFLSFNSIRTLTK